MKYTFFEAAVALCAYYTNVHGRSHVELDFLAQEIKEIKQDTSGDFLAEALEVSYRLRCLEGFRPKPHSVSLGTTWRMRAPSNEAA